MTQILTNTHRYILWVLLGLVSDLFDRAMVWLQTTVVETSRAVVGQRKESQKHETPVITISYEAYRAIKNTVGSKMPETGGILFGPMNGWFITDFAYDPSGRTTVATYQPNVKLLNPQIHYWYDQHQKEFMGFVHSHPPRCTKLSQGDLIYAQTFFHNDPDLEWVFLPVMLPGEIPSIYPYVLFRDDPWNPVEAELVVQDPEPQPKPAVSLADFSRLDGAVDVEFIKTQHVVLVGAGGASSYAEALARTGLGRLTVIEFDVTEESNVVRQGYTLSDVGRLKVDALGDRLKAVNPDLKYIPVNDDFTRMSEDDLELYVSGADLLVMATDSHSAQALGNVVAQKYKIPAIFSGFYKDSQAAELVFTIPGITSCYRCCVSPRYAYQEKKAVKLPSVGSTMFHSLLLDGYMGLLSMAILHRNKEGFQFSDWFKSSWKQNLLQLQLHPSFGQQEGHIFQRTYGEIDAAVNFNAIWQTIEPEDDCSDCAPKELVEDDNDDESGAGA